MTLTVPELMRQRYQGMKLPKAYSKILGTLPINIQWNMLVHGIAGSGKSTYSMALAQELSRFGNVLYGNFEEAVGPTLQNKIKTAKIRTTHIHFLVNNIESELWKQLDSGKYKYCIIDSLTHIAKTEKQVAGIWEHVRNYPNVSFILISHAKKTRDGKRESDYKGSSSIGHIVDINQRVVSGVVWNDKNRYLGRNCDNAEGYHIFTRKLVKQEDR